VKIWDKISEAGRWIGIIATIGGTIGGAVLFFDNINDNINTQFGNVMDTLSGFKKNMMEYQLKNNGILEIKSTQIDEVFKELKNLQINQKAIILKSDESKLILEEIRNQRLLDGSVSIDYLESKDAYIVQLKKKLE